MTPDVPKSPWEAPSWEKVVARWFPSLPVPRSLASARTWSRRKQRGRQPAGEEAMGPQVGVLLLAQLLVRVEPQQMQGELRPGSG